MPVAPRTPAGRAPRPVVKWAGGKRGLADELLRRIPPRIGTYVEPFCGGAALFFALAGEEERRFERAVLADTNVELVSLYKAIQKNVRALIARLETYQDEHLRKDEKGRRDHYYEVRALPTEGMSVVERGARLVFLNRTCFNGLWRVNASGRFNVPFGRYDKPKILDAPRLLEAHAAFKGVKIVEADFETVTRNLSPGDFAYFDPPYVPASRTANFTAYAKEGFGPKEQARLVAVLERLRDRGVAAMLSNTCSPETEALYAGFHRTKVPVPRPINSDPKKRGEVDELVVTTYATEPTKPAARRREAAS